MALVIPSTTTVASMITIPYTGGATQNLTLMCWGQITGSTGAATGSWRDFITADPNVYMQVFSDGVTMDFGSQTQDHNGSVLSPGRWYHLTMVVVPTSTTSRQFYGYINGQLNVNITDTTTFSTYTTLCIGNSVLSGFIYPLVGLIRDARIWTRALTPTEIVAEMNSRTVLHKQSLLLWSPFDTDTIRDKSGRNNVLTVGTGITLGSGAGALKPWPKKKR